MLREREALLSLRAGGPVHTPVIAITASATADYKQKCLDAGMDDWMPKPFDKNKLCHVLNRWLGECNGTGKNGYQDHQGASKEMIPEEERMSAERSNNERRTVEAREKISEIGETGELPRADSATRRTKRKSHRQGTQLVSRPCLCQ